MGYPERRERTPWWTVIAVAVVLFLAQVIPSPFRRHPSFSRFGPDKVLHFVGYAGFGAVLAEALAEGHLDDREAVYWAVGITAIYSAAISELQHVVPGRVPERADFVAGFLGSNLGALGWRWLADDHTS